ncbi:hypothetical protein [Inhella sp.]|uniref:hypothetical protein n=1 Tax=Inhella sp. TaxID=1921806 RepID=UPI0035B2C3E1
MPTTAPLPSSSVFPLAQPIQLSLVAPEPLGTQALAEGGSDAVAWRLGQDHARHGLPLPAAHLHPSSPLYAGWHAAVARRASHHRDPSPAQRQWLQLRLQAWTEGLRFDERLICPHYLQQLAQKHCPVTRAELHDEQGHPQQRCWARLRQHEGYAAGSLIQLGATAAAALQGRSLAQLQALAVQSLRQAEPVLGLDAAAWARLVSLVAMVSPEADLLGVQALLPPNRLHLRHATHALQAWLTRQLDHAGWSQRLQAMHERLGGVPQRQAATGLFAALAPHALCLPHGEPERRWALEDLWQDARVQRRWLALVELLSPLTVERLLRELPAPAGWVMERHGEQLAA